MGTEDPNLNFRIWLVQKVTNKQLTNHINIVYIFNRNEIFQHQKRLEACSILTFGYKLKSNIFFRPRASVFASLVPFRSAC